MKKVLLTVAIIVFVAGLVLMTSKNTIVRVSIEKGVEMVTGLRLKIDKIDVGLMTTLVGIDNLKLYNPPGFEDKVMLDMPEIYVDYDLPKILTGKIHLNKVRINMKEFTVVKNANGELNLDSLKVVKEQKTEKPAELAQKGKAPEMQIDSLELKVGKVYYKDYSKGGKPRVQEFNVSLNEKYTDINDPSQLVSLIVVKALSNTTIARLTGFDLKGLQGTITDTLGSAQKIVGGVQQVLVGVGSGQSVPATTGQVQNVVKGTADTAKTAVKDITEAINLPFGSKEE